MQPKISIIATVYNTERFLKKCFNSIINQTFKDWELIAVNDASPDSSSDILAYFESRDKRIKVINHPYNKGVDQARFTGLENAVGKYIMFVDSDDWIPENSLQLFYDKIEIEDADIVIGSMVKVLDKYKFFKTKPKNSPSGENLTENITLPELFDKYFINFFGVNLLPSYMCGKIYRRETLDKASLKPTSFCMFEDMIFNLTLHPFLTKISFITEVIYYYRFGGMTSTTTPHFLKTVKLQFAVKEEYIQKYNYTTATPFIKYELINCFYSHFKNLVLLDKVNYNKLEKLIEEEIKDNFYNKSLFEGIEISERGLALKSKEVDKIIQIVRNDVRRDRPKHLLKRIISGILH